MLCSIETRLSAADWLFLAGLLAALTAIHVSTGPLPLTGDEVGYVFQAVGIFASHSFHPSIAAWETFTQANGLVLRYQGRAGPFHTLFPGLLYGRVLVAVGFQAARWLNFLVGYMGTVGIVCLLKSAFPARQRALQLAIYATTAAIAISLPFVAYLKLLYPEVLLFAVVAGALWALVRNKLYGAAALTALLPFVYIRAFPLAMAFWGILLLHARRSNRVAPRLPMLCAGFAVALIAFATYQHAIFHSFRGDVFSVYPPSLALFPERLGMQLFGVRHGLLTYSPLYLVGFAGLLLGTIRRNRTCTYSTVLLLSYVLTFMWGEAGESWPARYWVAGLPFIAVGMCFWLATCTAALPRLVAVCLALANLVLTGMFAAHPLWFLESRRVSVPYFSLGWVFPVHFGLFLPVDVNSFGMPPYTETIPWLLALTVLAVGLLVAMGSRALVVQRLAAVASLGALALWCALCFAFPAPADAYRITALPSGGGIRIERLQAGALVVGVQFDDKVALVWSKQNDPQEFVIRCYGRAHSVVEYAVPSRPSFALPDCSGATAIDIRGKPESQARAFFTNHGAVTILER